MCAWRGGMNRASFALPSTAKPLMLNANERQEDRICMWRTVLGVLLLVSPATAYPERIEVKANVCGACHGIKGLPVEKTVPIIWGQNAGYLYLQLRDFQKGARKNAAMSVVAHDVVKGVSISARPNRLTLRETAPK